MKTALNHTIAALLLLLSHSASAKTGGPDSYGYTFNDNLGTIGGPEFHWIDISETGNVVLDNTGPDESSIGRINGIGGSVSLGAPFMFYGEVVTKLVPSANGYLSTDPNDDGSDSTNDCDLPAKADPASEGSRIYVYHDNLTHRGKVYYQHFLKSPHPHRPDGVSIFQWEDFSTSIEREALLFDFQVLLFANGDILMQYRSVTSEYGNGRSATTGIQNASATVGNTFGVVKAGLEYICNRSEGIGSGLAVLFEPPILVVTTAKDEFDILDGFSTGDGLSLREALAEAPAGAKIEFDASLDGEVIKTNYVTWNPGAVIHILDPALIVNQPVSIDASGLSNGISIDPHSDTGFWIRDYCSLNGVTITGTAPGAIIRFSPETARIFLETPTNSGAVLVENSGNSDEEWGFLVMSQCRIVGNGVGGFFAESDTAGVHLIGENSAPPFAWITDCEFTDNESEGSGAALYSSGTDVQCVDSKFLFNSSGVNGGAIYFSNGSLTLTNCGLTFNEAEKGAGIYALDASLNIDACSVASNTASGNGGGIFGENCTNFVRISTIGLNEALIGAGLYLEGGDTTVISSTISGNTATAGGGLMVEDGTLDITLTTIYQNSGGGIFAEGGSGADVFMQLSILADNMDDGRLQNLNLGPGGTFTSKGHNLTDSRPNNALFNALDLQGTDALLTPLGSYGGPTLTHVPLPESPAVDAVLVSTANLPDLPTDQRGFFRPADGNDDHRSGYDIGATENQGSLVVTTAVDELAEPGTGLSLREALDQVLPGGRIAFDPSLDGAVIRLAAKSGGAGLPLSLWQDCAIDASDLENGITLSGGNENSVLVVKDHVGATVINVHIVDGNSDFAGAGVNNDGDLTLIDCSVKDCRSQDGGGIFNGLVATLSLKSCTISNNLANSGNSGGGIYAETGGSITIEDCGIMDNNAYESGGGIYAENLVTLVVTRSTIGRNVCQINGGGIFMERDGVLDLTSSTISTNTAGDGGGAGFVRGSNVSAFHCTIANCRASNLAGGIVLAGRASLTLGHTIFVANGIDGKESNIDARLGASVTSLGYNILGTLGITQPTDIYTREPWLAPLSYYGGATETHALLTQSPAIDAGDPTLDAATAPASDQRGFDRVVQGEPLADFAEVDRIDIGAVEAGREQRVTSLADADTGVGYRLRVALEQAAPGERIIFNGALSVLGGVIDLSTASGGEGAPLKIDKTLQIDATAVAGGITIKAGRESRIFGIDEGVSASLHGLTLRLGSSTGDGGAIRTSGNLTITHSCLIGNDATQRGGAIAALGGRLFLQNATVSENSAAVNGGGIYFGIGATGRIEHSTIFSNTVPNSNVAGIDLFTSPVDLYSSIVAGNISGSGEANFGVADSFEMHERLNSLGYNLTNSDLDILATYLGDLVNTLPSLEPAAKNGGWGITHHLKEGSPAIDAGDPSPFLLPQYDQRGPGYDRIKTSPMDMGALEYGHPAPDENPDPPVDADFVSIPPLQSEGTTHQITAATDDVPGAKIRYYSTKPDILRVKGDTLIPGSAGTATIKKERRNPDGTIEIFEQEINVETTGTEACPAFGLTAQLLAPDGAANDRLGRSVAVLDRTILAGAAAVDHQGLSDAGSAYLFVRSNNRWKTTTKLVDPNPASDGKFGLSVAIGGVGGNMALIGAPGKSNGAGEVHVFGRNGQGNWTHRQRLQATNPDPGDAFGVAVAIHGRTALVGAIGDDDQGADGGAVYSYRLNNANNWVLEGKFTGSDTTAGDRFGSAIDLDNEQAIIGAPGNSNGQGAAYILNHTGQNSWPEVAKLTASNGNANDAFGSAVVLRKGDLAVIGAPQRESAYTFESDAAGIWIETGILTANNGQTGDVFGSSVGIDDCTVIVGAPLHDTTAGTDAGAAYVFVEDAASNWTQDATLTVFDAQPQDQLGFALDVAGGILAVGAPLDDDKDADGGSVYVYESGAQSRRDSRFREQPEVVDWVTEHFGKNDPHGGDVDVDDDGDGLSRLMEFFHGLDPAKQERINETWIQFTKGDQGDEPSIDFLYRISKRARRGFDFIVEESTDGNSWADVEKLPEVVLEDEETTVFCMRQNAPDRLSGPADKLLRLRVNPKVTGIFADGFESGDVPK